MMAQMSNLSLTALTSHEANGPIARQPQRACHGGVPNLLKDRICTKPALGKNRSDRRQFAVLVPYNIRLRA
jgi:hypothetical protein